MATVKIKDADGADVYFQVAGTGTDLDPFRYQQEIVNTVNQGKPFELCVAQALVDGYWFMDKFGFNTDVDSGSVPEDIWEGGGAYPFSVSADIESLSSSNSGDTQDILVVGLGADGNEVEQTITLAGQTRVALTTNLLRVYRMENEGTTDLAGNCFCYSGTTSTGGVPSGGSVEKARIENGNNQTLMAIYTVPLGKVGFLYRGEIGIGNDTNNGNVKCYWQSRRYQKVFKVKKAVTMSLNGNSIFQDSRSFPDPIPALTDIRMRVANASDNNNNVFGAFDIMLVDEDKLDPAYLTLIGQPSST